jgi:alkylation response protein AidB-like acyl-CoA dehydrogenase
MSVALFRTETQIAIADTIGGMLNRYYDFAKHRAATAKTVPSVGIWSRLAELGLLGIEVGEINGGIGGTFAETAVILEALGAALSFEPFVPTAVLGVGILNALGTPEQVAAFLAQIVAGNLKMSLAHDEGMGARITSTATRIVAGWRLQGRKVLVLGGDSSDVVLFSALVEDEVSLFILPIDTPGVTRHAYDLYDNQGAADLNIDAVVCEIALLGRAGMAQPAIDLAFDRGAAAAIHQAIGAMDRLCAMTLDYLKTRVQFEKPLATFQVLQHRMVDMHMALETARSMALLATAALDEVNPVVRARDISAAKLHVGDAARLIGQTSVQLHGGIALTDEYPAGHYFKRLTMLARQFGDELYHLDRFSALEADCNAVI